MGDGVQPDVARHRQVDGLGSVFGRPASPAAMPGTAPAGGRFQAATGWWGRAAALGGQFLIPAEAQGLVVAAGDGSGLAGRHVSYLREAPAFQFLTGGKIIRLDLLIVGLHIDLGGLDPAMPHELLDAGDRHIGIEQIVQRVSQPVAGQVESSLLPVAHQAHVDGMSG